MVAVVNGMISISPGDSLATYRDEMRIEFSRNVDRLNRLLIQLDEGQAEKKQSVTQAVCDSEDPLRCNLIRSSGAIVKSIGSNGVLRKLKTLQSELRLRQLRIDQGTKHSTNVSTPTASSCDASFARDVRLINSQTPTLINKLKHQLRVLGTA